MIFEENVKKTGKKYIVCSKYWPDGSRLRRRFSNKTLAKSVLSRIEGAIAMGNWKELKRELTEPPPEPPKDFTMREFADIYLEEYCKVRNTRPDFKEVTLKPIKEIVGHVKLREFMTADAAFFEKERAKSVSGPTVNRGLAVLSNLLTFAFKKGLIDRHPMSRYGRIPEDEKALRVMTLAEERQLVQAVTLEDPIIGAYVGILGETGLRMTEGLELEWEDVLIGQKQLVVKASKNHKVRYVPLSEYAIQLFRSLPRGIDCSHAFIRTGTTERWRDPRGPFLAGRKAVGMEWVGFHDFRHFRASQWVMRGIDLRTVQELLGHLYIATTMRYAHFAPDHATRTVLAAYRVEEEQLRRESVASGDK
jgi:integrase